VETRKRFLKTLISVDTDLQAITGLKISQHPLHDIPHTEKLLIQCHRTRQSELYAMDKGYNSEDIHRRSKTCRILMYYPCQEPNKIHLRVLSSRYETLVRYRSIPSDTIETLFSVLKKKFGKSIKSRKYRLRIKGIKIKILLSTIISLPVRVEVVSSAENYVHRIPRR